ncbi:retrovirus-related pol polyprotein from transposon TNT 1-94, partial [Tanacetum coccineum]
MGASSRTTLSYYVTHPSSVVDYDDDYQGDAVQNTSEDPLTSAMILLARDRPLKEFLEHVFRNCCNCSMLNCSKKGHYARNCPKPGVRDSKYFMEQMLLAKHDEAEVILTDEHNDFLFADASRMEEIEELSANICLMARIQPANFDSDAGPSYDSAFLSEHEKERKECESSLKNVCETSWISKMENLESENVSLEYQVQSLIKEQENVKSEYQKLFDSIKKTRTQTQSEINELVEHVNQKTYTYADTSPTKKKEVETNQNVIAPGMYKVTKQQETNTKRAKSVLPSKGLSVASSVRRPLNSDSPLKNSVLSNTRKSSKKVEVSVRTNKETHVASKNVVSNKNIVVQIVMWIVNSRCSKHMTGDRSLLENFVVKFMGTIRFGNDHFAAITGYGDYVQGNITVCHVHYVEGLGHNLFSVGQFCDGARESNLYTISISNMAASSPVCLISKATSTKSWLWHRRLSHLNFGTINNLTKHDLVDGLLKFKYGKDHLCSACERGKSKKASHPPKVVPIDDYSRFTWVYILRTKDETLEIIKNFIARVQLNYNAKVHKIRTDNGTEFKNAILKAHYEKLGIMQQFLIARTPQQNGVVERQNQTLVEAARTMLIFLRLPEFLWAE